MLSSGLEVIKEEKRLNSLNRTGGGGIKTTGDTGGEGKKGKKRKSNSKEKRNCRICLCEESEAKDDPIISPCTCKGSSGDIHLKCL